MAESTRQQESVVVGAEASGELPGRTATCAVAPDVSVHVYGGARVDLHAQFEQRDGSYRCTVLGFGSPENPGRSNVAVFLHDLAAVERAAALLQQHVAAVRARLAPAKGGKQ